MFKIATPIDNDRRKIRAYATISKNDPNQAL